MMHEKDVVFSYIFSLVLFHVEKNYKIHGNSKHFRIYSQLGLGYKGKFLAECDESGDLY